MKNRIIILLITFIGFIENIHSQAFDKGNINIDLDMGGSAYGVLVTSKVELGTIKLTDTDVDATAAGVFRIGAEYGLSKRFGLGIKLGSSNHVIAKDDKDTVKSITTKDFAFLINFHMLNAERNDLFLTLGLGFVYGDWEYQENPGIFLDEIEGSGGYLCFGLTDRIFFSDHIGILFSLQYAAYNYKGLEPELSAPGKAIVGNLAYKWTLDYELKGVYLGTGLAVKF